MRFLLCILAFAFSLYLPAMAAPVAEASARLKLCQKSHAPPVATLLNDSCEVVVSKDHRLKCFGWQSLSNPYDTLRVVRESYVNTVSALPRDYG